MYYLTYITAEADELRHFRESAPCYSPDSDVLPRVHPWSEEEAGKIRTVLRKLTSLRIRNDEDAEDLVQETLLTVTANFPDCILNKGLLVWCMGVLRKKVGNYYRKVNRFEPLGGREAPPLNPGWKDIGAPSQEGGLRLIELQELVEQILARFPDAERRPVELYLAGLPTCEIAQQLQPERYQTVVNRIFRGRKKLACALARHGYAPSWWRR